MDVESLRREAGHRVYCYEEVEKVDRPLCVYKT